MAEMNSRMDEAVEAVRGGQFKYLKHAAEYFEVNRDTLSRRLKGCKNHAQGHESMQLLSNAEEDALSLWCKRLTAGGYPASHQVVKEMAMEILLRRVAKINTADMQLVTTPTIGKEWVKRFLKRHPILATVSSKAIDSSRWRDTTPEVINTWFDVFEDVLNTYRFEDHNIYNMDETGFAIGTSQSNRVIVDSSLRTRYKAEPGRQEWVTVVECISVDGTALPPLVIFKAKNISGNWISKSTPWDWLFSNSSKGWTSNEHGMEWLRRVFQPATREKAMGKPRLLICDGHDSHISGNFIVHCMEYNIVLLVLPPHTSHYTQPLDVAVFGPLATALGQETDRLTSITSASRISKAEWVELYTKARQKAVTSQNIHSSWRGAGLFPLQRSKVLRHIVSMRPTTPTPTIPLDQCQQNPLEAISSSPPDPLLLRQANATFNSQLVSGNLLDTPAQKYAKNLTSTSERLAAQVAILRKERKDQEEVLKKKQRRQSGKRAAVKGHFVLSTAEIREKVQAAELETARRKAGKRATKKRKRQETPSEDEEETAISSSDGEISDMSDCIAVSRS
jgi:hypothetical protein